MKSLHFDFVLSRDFDNLSPRDDLEIFALSWDSENLSPRVDLEIFTLSWDSDNLSPQPRCNRARSNEVIKLRAMQSLESTVFIKDSRVSRNRFSDRSLINNYRELESVHHRRGSQPTSMSTYLIFNQLQIIHPQFRPKSRSSVLEPSQNFLSNQDRVFLLKRGTKQRRDYMSKRPPQNVAQEGNYNTIELYSKVPQNSSKMALSHILIFPCCHSKCSYIVVISIKLTILIL
ncbi:neurotrimin-like isoform X2 [Vespula maculifrons]|uniref:Neurotrimin-like isoform X2 n=1 Tax=Vespula maculifrons TaxID=7453 RepID=A0ABD2AXE1_VESMC